MTSTVDKSVVKKLVMELLEEDVEFRYAVAAKVGLLEILQKLEEHDKKFYEILSELREHRKILERHEAEIKKIWEKLEEHDRKFIEILSELREHRKILERHEEILEKHGEMLVSLKRYSERHEKAIGSLGETLGVLAETILVDKVKEYVLENARVYGEDVVSIRHKYRVNEEYEIDLYIETNKTIYVIEVKTKPSIKHVKKLYRVREYIESRETRKVKPILVTLKARLSKEVAEEAEKHNIELILY